MTHPLAKTSLAFRSAGERLIRVLTTTPKNNNFHALTFPESEIKGIEEMGQDRSALVLRSGEEIPVALPYEELEQKIFSPSFRTDGPVLDLREVTGEAAKPKPPANVNQCEARNPSSLASVPGDKMPDGTVYAGISPDTEKKMYAMPTDASLTMTFNDAKEYAQGLNTQKAQGHDDWRVPTKAELNVLFNNRAAIGGFNVSGSNPAGWYWSSMQGSKWRAWEQRFSDGAEYYYDIDAPSSVRLVR